MQFQCPKCKAILASYDVAEGMIVACPECSASATARATARGSGAAFLTLARQRTAMGNKGHSRVRQGQVQVIESW